MKFHEGYKDIKVKLLNFDPHIAKKVYEFGRLSNDFPYKLIEQYNVNHPDCKKLIDKIVNGTTLPKFAKEGLRLEFEIDGISRICLAQITRDHAIFASASNGVFALTQDFNIPLSICKEVDVMNLLRKAQFLLEEAYIRLAEREVPALEARYIGLHSQTVSLTASYTISDFVRSCYSRTSSNFCDECNLVYRLMYRELHDALKNLVDFNDLKLWHWLVNESNCINDKTYKREFLYNSDFTPDPTYNAEKSAINDWRNSGWKLELERMYRDGTGYLTEKEIGLIESWLSKSKDKLITTYDSTSENALCNNIKETDYYEHHRK